MAKVCSSCGAESGDDSRFCGSCGAALSGEAVPPTMPIPETAPGIPWAPPGPPPAPALAARAPIDIAAAVRTATGGGIAAPLKVAGTMLAVSFVLSVAVGLLEMVHAPHVHWTFAAVTTLIGTIWASIFGADLGAKADIHAGMFTFSGSGGLSFVPLTLTVLTLGAGIVAYRRATARQSTLLGSALTAATAALATVIPLLVMTWVVGMNTHDIEKVAGVSDCASSSTSSNLGGSYDSNGNYIAPSASSSDNGSCLNNTVGEALTSGSHINIGPSSTQVFFFGFVLILVVLLAATLARRELYAGRYSVWVRNLIRGPVSGFGWLLVGLIPAGWIYFAFVWTLRPTGAGIESHPLSAHDWMNLLTGVFSAGGNLGFIGLGLGAWGKYGGSYSAAGHEDGRHFGLSWIAGNHGGSNDPGFWAAAGLAPLVIAFAVFMVARSARQDGPSAARLQVGAWIVSMLVAFPLLDWMSSVGVHASAAVASGHASSGFNTWATFTVFGYSLLIGVAVLAVTGGLKGFSMPRLDALRSSTPAAPVTYNVGDVVNGHRFTGTEWVPVEE